MYQECNQDFDKGGWEGVEPEGKIFYLKNASMGQRAEQTSATHA